MTAKPKCGICGRVAQEMGFVWYSQAMPCTWLCPQHLRRWNRRHAPYRHMHRKTRPATRGWDWMCDEEANLFVNWMKAQSGGSP